MTLFQQSCIFFLICGLVTTGCHTTRKVATHTKESKAVASDKALYTSSMILKELEENKITYHTFSAKMQVDITNGKRSQQGITTFIRMQKDSMIWISVRPILGIELARALITPDSVKLINYLKGTVTLRSADSLQQILDIPFKFTTLQNLIIGNPVLLTDQLENIEQDSTTVRFTCHQKNLVSKYVAQLSPFFIKENQLSDKDLRTRYANQQFNHYISVDNRPFALQRQIKMRTTQSTTKISIQYSQISFDDSLTFPFAYGKQFSIQ